ncbi:MAG: hypothetical protein JW804_08385 [Sedimentisphaerales bacterium]|nr:hypothetical protein [Sedimentisphaerales bacterium]
MQKLDCEIIVRKYGKSVWQSAYRILGNSADAAPTCRGFQETFLSAYETSREQRVNNFRAFLSAVAVMRAVSRFPDASGSG